MSKGKIAFLSILVSTIITLSINYFYELNSLIFVVVYVLIGLTFEFVLKLFLKDKGEDNKKI